MKAFGGYDNVKASTGEKLTLPPGGYVLKILDAKVESRGNGSEQMIISFDIEEGDHKDFFKRQYAGQQGEDKKWKGTYRLWLPKDDGTEQDEWTKKKFKSMIVAVEESNKDFHWNWDESKLKNKLVGGIFNEKEYSFKGYNGFFTQCHHMCDVETIRSGGFKVPKQTLLKGSSESSADVFTSVPEGITEELPFK